MVAALITATSSIKLIFSFQSFTLKFSFQSSISLKYPSESVTPTYPSEHKKCYNFLLFIKDAKQTGKLKVVEKGEKLVEANRVAACSFVQETDCTFCKGFVSAAMKKKVRNLY